MSWRDRAIPVTDAAPSGDWRSRALPVTEEQPEVGMLESGIRGGAQGVTMGFQDEITGGLRGAVDKVLGSDETLLDLYTKHRDAERERNAQAKAANPWTYGATNVAGAVAPALLTGGGATAGARILGSAVQGGAMGLGNSEADLTKGEVGDAAADTLLGAGTGAAFSGGVEGIRAGVNALRGQAPNLAVKSLGGTNKQNANLSPERRSELGQWLLDRKMIRAGRTVRDSAKNLKGAERGAGEEIGRVLTEADAGIPGIPTEPIADRLRENVIEAARPTNLSSALAAGERAVDDIAEKGRLSLNELNQLGNKIGNVGYNDAGGNAGKAVLRNVERGVDKAIQENLPNNLLPQYALANKEFALATTARKMADKGAAKLDTNRGFSLTDYLLGIAGSAATMSPKGLLLMGANKAARERGAQTAAVGLEALNKAAQHPSMQKFIPVLREAAAKGTSALSITHYLLSQRDPEYQKALHESNNQ